MTGEKRRGTTTPTTTNDSLVVDDPFEKVNPKTGKRPKIRVAANLRNDRLGYMFSRRLVSHAQYAAGRKWQLVHEQTTVGRIRAIDPTREPVDDSRIPDVLNDSMLKASKELDRARQRLGTEGHLLIVAVLVDGKSLEELATEAVGREANWYHVKKLGRRFRECLDTLAGLWGFAPDPHHSASTSNRKAIRSWRA